MTQEAPWGIISWTLPQELEETACELMVRLGSLGAAVTYPAATDVTIQAYFPPGLDLRRLADELLFRLSPQTAGSLARPQIGSEARIDWVAHGRDAHRAVTAGRHFLIHPSWDAPADPRRPLLIQIDPQQAFGTGSHETTRLCIDLMEKYHRARHTRCLDAGCGSGILMIALDRWAGWRCPRTAPRFRVDGIDLDAASVEVARENLAVNRVRLSHAVHSVPLEEFQSAPYHFIFANLLSGIILSHRGHLDRLLRPGGLMVLSGILGEELHDMRPAAAERGWTILDEARAGDWAALVVRKPSAPTPPVR